jgi:hypothetical protein
MVETACSEQAARTRGAGGACQQENDRADALSPLRASSDRSRTPASSARAITSACVTGARRPLHARQPPSEVGPVDFARRCRARARAAPRRRRARLAGARSPARPRRPTVHGAAEERSGWRRRTNAAASGLFAGDGAARRAQRSPERPGRPHTRGSPGSRGAHRFRFTTVSSTLASGYGCLPRRDGGDEPTSPRAKPEPAARAARSASALARRPGGRCPRTSATTSAARRAREAVPLTRACTPAA